MLEAEYAFLISRLCICYKRIMHFDEQSMYCVISGICIFDEHGMYFL